MDQIYPLQGTTTTSCASQHFDFLNYWVDQTVEKEILRGKELRELKERPRSIRKEKNKSPVKSKKRVRRNSLQSKTSPTRIFTKKESKSSRHRCSMRIAELSVPSKRQCIDTWRTKYHVLPGIMIDRLRKHILDLSPVVKIPDAFECFKRHKLKERKINIEAKDKKKRAMKKCDKCNDKIKKKPTKVQECRYLCAIFGHKIAKELNKPVQITLNTELQNIFNVVSIEIEKLLCKGNKVVNRTIKNNKVKAEVSGKITIWISRILEETAYKILEDQLKDLEEEVGPVLDLIDDLVENVVEICEPEPEFIAVFSSSETYSMESSDNEERGESEEGDNLSFDTDFPPETEPVELNLDGFIKIELDQIINSFDRDISSDIDDIAFSEVENQTTQNNIEFKDTKQDQTQQNNIYFEDIADKEQHEFEDVNDTLEVPLSEPDAQSNSGGLQAEAIEGPLITDQERDADLERSLVNDLISEDDSNKKVKFSVINMVTTDDITEQGAQIIPEHFKHHQFSLPNDHLLDYKNEPWPEEWSPPILRPSESVSKSITSLGNIMETEENMSVMLEDDANGKIKRIVNDTTADENTDQLEGNARIWKDTITVKKPQAKINNTINTINDDNDQLKDGSEMRTNNLTDSRLLNDDGTIHETKNVYKSNTVFDGNIDTTSHDMEKDGYEPIHTYSDKYRRTDNSGQESNKDDTKQTDAYIIGTYNGEDGETYTVEKDSENDIAERTDTSTSKDGKIYTKEQTDLPERTYTHRKEQDIEKDSTGRIDKYIREDGETYIKEQLFQQYGTKQADQIVERGAIIIQSLSHLAVCDGIHRSSTDSTFDHDFPTETVPYEQKLYKIFEEQATQVATLHEIRDKATQVGIKDETSTAMEIKTADKEINSTFSLVPRTDKSTSVVSQSLGDITKRLQGVKADDMFSSLRIKAKVDYKVHKNSAPSWVTRNFGEPSDSSYTSSQHQKKRSNDKNIRLWCKDLENGFNNLELWNGWIENTIESVKIMEMKKARIGVDKSREELVRDWLDLKKNVDADVLTWTKLSKSTQESLKGFRKICQIYETPPQPPPIQNKNCNCHT